MSNLIPYDFLSVLRKNTPEKQKHVEANNSNFLNKNLRKAMKTRTRFRV